MSDEGRKELNDILSELNDLADQIQKIAEHVESVRFEESLERNRLLDADSLSLQNQVQVRDIQGRMETLAEAWVILVRKMPTNVRTIQSMLRTVT